MKWERYVFQGIFCRPQGGVIVTIHYSKINSHYWPSPQEGYNSMYSLPAIVNRKALHFVDPISIDALQSLSEKWIQCLRSKSHCSDLFLEKRKKMLQRRSSFWRLHESVSNLSLPRENDWHTSENITKRPLSFKKHGCCKFYCVENISYFYNKFLVFLYRGFLILHGLSANERQIAICDK